MRKRGWSKRGNEGEIEGYKRNGGADVGNKRGKGESDRGGETERDKKGEERWIGRREG